MAVAAPVSAGEGAPVASAQPPVSTNWEALVRQVEHGSPLVGSQMRLGVRLIELAPGLLRYQLAPGLPGDPSAEIRKALETVTGMAWQVERGEGAAQPSLEEARAEAEREAGAALRRSPLVAAALATFPGAELIEDDAPPSGERKWSRRA